MKVEILLRVRLRLFHVFERVFLEMDKNIQFIDKTQIMQMGQDFKLTLCITLQAFESKIKRIIFFTSKHNYLYFLFVNKLF